MRPEQLIIDGKIWDSLYPFHIVLCENDQSDDDEQQTTHTSESRSTTDSAGYEPHIQWMGPLLKKVIGSDCHGELFHENFKVLRPMLNSHSFSSLSHKTDKLVRIMSRASGLELRGQLVKLSERQLIFLGTVDVLSSANLRVKGYSINDLPPHDLMPDMMMMQEILTKQVNELRQSYATLVDTRKQRDESDTHAKTDAMTRLLNRRGFISLASGLLSNTQGEKQYSICLIDINRFKLINDNYGHNTGDFVIETIAKTMTDIFSSDVLLGRWGGDEFIAMGPSSELEHVFQPESEAFQQLQKTLEFDNHKVEISITAGLAACSCTDDAATIDSLIHKADMAMYESRRTGDCSIGIYAGSMKQKIERRELIARLLPPAIEKSQIKPHYQPIIDLSSGNLVGFEALARWQSPEAGSISPVDFIEIADRLAVLKEFDWMMIEQIVTDLSSWSEVRDDFNIHVNLSAPSFTLALVDRLEKLIKQHGISSNRLVIELTETSLLLDSTRVKRVMQELLNRGFPVELDDFGTGYSSLVHLRDFPITGIKVDMSFVKDSLQNKRTRKLLKGILKMANDLNLHSVAEGVETIEQKQLLESLKCQSFQGHLAAKPMAAEQAWTMLLDPKVNKVA